jgi:hypothetical protein
MEAPKFNLNASNLGFESQEQLDAEVNKPQGKGFQPGNYDLQIISAEFHKNKITGSIYCESDETWLNVVVTLQGAEERTTKTWIQVPTTKVKFGPKNTLFVYKKFVEFMASIGEAVTLENLGKLVPKYFSAPSETLPGLKLNADIGYEGPHVAKAEDGSCTIVRGNKPVEDENGVMTFPDVASAKAVAEGMGIKLTYPNIVKFTAKKKAATASKKDDSGW